jgi:hypothetical protein
VSRKVTVQTAPVPPADAEQVAAAKLVYYGRYECEFNQTINIASDAAHDGYARVQYGKASYLMKPVLSSTGAVRLEDVKGDTLMVQIANKSMLMNVRVGQRMVDDCISPQQRDLIQAAARVADEPGRGLMQNAPAPAMAASAASAPGSQASTPLPSVLPPPASPMAPGEPASAPLASR